MVRPEGIYECEGCGEMYPEYVNGCLFDHAESRKVVCVVADPIGPMILDVLSDSWETQEGKTDNE